MDSKVSRIGYGLGVEGSEEGGSGRKGVEERKWRKGGFFVTNCSVNKRVLVALLINVVLKNNLIWLVCVSHCGIMHCNSRTEKLEPGNLERSVVCMVFLQPELLT